MSKQKFSLADLLNGDGSQQNVHIHIPLHDIIVLQQMRQTFEPEGIAILANNIATHGLIQAITVSELDYDRFDCYLDVFNQMWGREYSINQFKAVAKNTKNDGQQQLYYPLAAGERRLRAFHYLYDHGCDKCNAQYGQESPGVCFKRHTHSHKVIVPVNLRKNVGPLSALYYQFAENGYKPVDSHEEAIAVRQLWILARSANPKITLVDFCNDICRSTSSVSDALHYCELPKDIQDFVIQGHIAYGAALELWRLWTFWGKMEMQDEDELKVWVIIALDKKVSDFKEKVDAHIASVSSGQGDLFSDMQVSAELLSRATRRKKVLEADMIKAISHAEGYLQKVIYAYETGLIGKDDSPISEQSVLRHLHRQINILERLLPYMEQKLKEIDWKKWSVVTKICKQYVLALQEVNQDT
jgi:hypothetical protein